MEIQNTAPAMLALLPQPSFCAENGMIVHVNDAARKLQITPGIQVMDILQTGKDEYSHFSDGCLYLSIVLSECQFSACVTKVNSFDVFTLSHTDNKAQLQSLALAAKELRRPLADIMTVAESLFPAIEPNSDTKTSLQIAQLNRSLYQLQRIIGNMSDAGRLKASASSQLEMRDICSVLQELVQDFEGLAAQNDLTFRYHLPSQRIYCPIDTELLERAVYNLISNAFKFTPKGGQIELHLQQQRNYLYLSVTNYGTIPSELLGGVFTRYLRSPAIEDSRYGIGLGMVLVRSAAAAHGGTVLIQQSDDQHVRVTMSIPLGQKDTMLRSHIQKVDYTGERSHLLIELSDCLRAENYKSENTN